MSKQLSLLNHVPEHFN